MLSNKMKILWFLITIKILGLLSSINYFVWEYSEMLCLPSKINATCKISAPSKLEKKSVLF